MTIAQITPHDAARLCREGALMKPRGSDGDHGHGALHGAGPSLMYAAQAVEAYDQFAAPKG